MKKAETFSTFQTRFLHLAGQAQIPQEDLMPDLFDKLTLELQRAVLPVYTTIRTLKELTDHCIALDQGLRRIQTRADRLKARSLGNASTAQAACNPTVLPAKTTATTATTAATARPAAREPTPTLSRSSTPKRTRPTYSNPTKQALSNQGACFNCGLKGHFARDCPTKDGGAAIY